MKKLLEEYRSDLTIAEQKAQEDFDKAVLTLSSSALGISFVFIKDIAVALPIKNHILIFFAWICWGISISSILLSYFFSHLALRKAIKQVDSGEIYKSHPGGFYDLVTRLLNAFGAILFLAGVILLSIFAYINLGA